VDKIAVIITNLRKEKNWSQTDLAKQSDVSREMISKYERSIAMPSVDAAKKIADAFDVSLDYLVGNALKPTFDKRMVQRLQDFEILNNNDKDHLLALLDAFLRDAKTKKAYTS